MFHTISEKIIVFAIKNKILAQEKADEYIYGIEITLSVIVSYVSVLVIGLLMNMFWESAVFLFLFVLMRRFAGGFHFRSQLACYIFMCITTPVILLTIKFAESDTVTCSAIMIISSLLLLILSPVPAIEKPLDKKEQVVYGRVARIIVVGVCVIYTILHVVQQLYLAKIITVTVCAVAIFSVLGKLKQMLYRIID